MIQNRIARAVKITPLFILLLSCKLNWGDQDRSQGQTPEGEIGFYVSGGTSFTPKIELASGGSALWRFTGYEGGSVSGDSISSSLAPNVGYSGKMLATLTVTPWSALRTINLGYDGADGGTLGGGYLLAQQNVHEVRNLSLAQQGLIIWCSSGDPISSLDFTGFASLTTIESFGCATLSSIGLGGTSSLQRLCIEASKIIGTLDLSGCPNLADLRAASNTYAHLVFPAGQMPYLWHICIRDNTQLVDQLPALTKFPALKELWIWNTGQAGALSFSSASSETFIQAWSNSYTSATLVGAFGTVLIYGNSLSDVNISGVSAIHELNLSGNQLTDPVIEGIYSKLKDFSTPGTVDVSGAGNGHLTPAAIDYKTTMTGNGWTVKDNG